MNVLFIIKTNKNKMLEDIKNATAETVTLNELK